MVERITSDPVASDNNLEKRIEKIENSIQETGDLSVQLFNKFDSINKK